MPSTFFLTAIFIFQPKKQEIQVFFLWKVKKSSQKFACFKRMPYICSA